MDKDYYELSKDIHPISIEDLVNSLIADEFIAWYMYYFLERASRGKSLNYIKKIFDENGEDELDDHLNKLITWMNASQYKCEFNISKMMDIATCKAEQFLDGVSTKSAIEIMIRSEDCAIQSLMKAHDQIKDSHPDLDNIIMDILNDEQEHKKKLLDIKSTWKDYDIFNFSERVDNINNLMENLYE